jgi:hypothetical protein
MPPLHKKCTAELNLGNPLPLLFLGLGRAGSGFPGNPSAKGAIELSARSWPRQRIGRKLTHKTRCGCVRLHWTCANCNIVSWYQL